MRRLVILPLAVLLSIPASATPPAALAHVSGGLWEVSGLPPSRRPVQQCVTDILTFAQFEHRGRACSRTEISSGATTTKFSYSCGAGNFGQSQIDVITPRSLRVSTQGVSDQLPFAYVLQARRVGECTKSGASQRH